MTDFEDMQNIEKTLSELPDGAVRDFVSANREDVAAMVAEELAQEQVLFRMSQGQE